MDIEKKIEVILQTVIDDNKEPMTHIQFIKQKNKWVSEIKWLIKSNSLLTSISEQEKYDQGFHDGANKTAIELSESDTVEQNYALIPKCSVCTVQLHPIHGANCIAANCPKEN